MPSGSHQQALRAPQVLGWDCQKELAQSGFPFTSCYPIAILLSPTPEAVSLQLCCSRFRAEWVCFLLSTTLSLLGLITELSHHCLCQETLGCADLGVPKQGPCARLAQGLFF